MTVHDSSTRDDAVADTRARTPPTGFPWGIIAVAIGTGAFGAYAFAMARVLL